MELQEVVRRTEITRASREHEDLTHSYYSNTSYSLQFQKKKMSTYLVILYVQLLVFWCVQNLMGLMVLPFLKFGKAASAPQVSA